MLFKNIRFKAIAFSASNNAAFSHLKPQANDLQICVTIIERYSSNNCTTYRSLSNLKISNTPHWLNVPPQAANIDEKNILFIFPDSIELF